MKSIKRYLITLSSIVIAGIIFTSCEKTFDSKFATEGVAEKSTAQVYMAMVNANRNYVYVDAVPVTGALMSTGTVFPSTGFGFSVAGGIRDFLVRDTLSTTTQIPLSFGQNMAQGKNYTIFIYDTINSPKQKTVATDIVVPTDTSARIRFANFAYSSTAIPAVDIFSKKKNVNVFSNVNVTDVTSYVPYPSGITDTFYIRPAGSLVNMQVFVPTPAPGAWADMALVFTPTQKRSYTMLFRGSYNALVSTAATVRRMDVFINR